jgi:uncharacterized protein
MPPSSPISAGAVFLDKAKRTEDVRAAARRAAARLPAIRRVVLFGSLAAGIPTPRSDADLLIVVDASDCAHVRDRIPPMLAAMSPLPCPVDLVVLTTEELGRAQKDGDPVVREALTYGVDLLG